MEMADSYSKHEPSDSGKKGGGKGLIIGGVVLIVILLLVVIILLIARSQNNEQIPEAQPVSAGTVESSAEDQRSVITAENAEEAVTEMLTGTPKNIPTSYTVTQNSDWNFHDGASASTNAYVENDPSNETPVFFDIVVDETGETVYSSPVLELGAKLESIKLDKELPQGTYPCTMTYHLVDDKQNTLTTVSVGVNLVIEN
jgi:cytoskeletal protein RodZ